MKPTPQRNPDSNEEAAAAAFAPTLDRIENGSANMENSDLLSSVFSAIAAGIPKVIAAIYKKQFETHELSSHKGACFMVFTLNGEQYGQAIVFALNPVTSAPILDTNNNMPKIERILPKINLDEVCRKLSFDEIMVLSGMAEDEKLQEVSQDMMENPFIEMMFPGLAAENPNNRLEAHQETLQLNAQNPQNGGE